MPSRPAPFDIQRSLVKPLLLPTALANDSILATLRVLGTETLSALLVQHGLAPLWFELLAGSPDAPEELHPLLPALKSQRTRHILNSKLQHHTAIQVQASLAKSGINSVVFKGVQLANTLYRDPGLRPSADIDLLIPAGQQREAIRHFKHQDVEFLPNANTICYQTALQLKQIEIDLHWGFVRPGRTRTEIADILFRDPRIENDLRIPNDEASLIALLIHPLTSTRPHAADAKLIRLIDLAYWLDRHSPDWEEVLRLLNTSDTLHVAWLMIDWLNEVTDHELSITPPSALNPQPWKQRWLRRWLQTTSQGDKAPSALSVQLGYRTALHAGPAGAMRELVLLGKEKLLAQQRMRQFQSWLEDGLSGS